MPGLKKKNRIKKTNKQQNPAIWSPPSLFCISSEYVNVWFTTVVTVWGALHRAFIYLFI